MWGPCEGTYLGRWHVLVCTRGGKLMCHCMCSSIISFLKDSLQINVIKCCWIFIFFKRKLTGRGDALRYCTRCRLCHSALPASAPADGGGSSCTALLPSPLLPPKAPKIPCDGCPYGSPPFPVQLNAKVSNPALLCARIPNPTVPHDTKQKAIMLPPGIAGVLSTQLGSETPCSKPALMCCNLGPTCGEGHGMRNSWEKRCWEPPPAGKMHLGSGSCTAPAVTCFGWSWMPFEELLCSSCPGTGDGALLGGVSAYLNVALTSS